MRYNERLPSDSSVGCLPAGIFAALAYLPAAFLILRSECSQPGGGLGECPNNTVLMMRMLGAVALLSFFIVWATNRMVIAASSRSHPKFWGLLGGFLLSATLLMMLTKLWTAGLLP